MHVRDHFFPADLPSARPPTERPGVRTAAVTRYGRTGHGFHRGLTHSPAYGGAPADTDGGHVANERRLVAAGTFAAAHGLGHRAGLSDWPRSGYGHADLAGRGADRCRTQQARSG